MENLLSKDKKWLSGEGFSANVVTNAKGLAKMGAFMANKGSFEGKQYISEETWNTFHGEQKLAFTDNFFMTNFNQGGCAHYAFTDEMKNGTAPGGQTFLDHTNNGREGFVGWQGFGGSVLQWHPEEHVSFAYVPFDFIFVDLAAKRALELQKLVMDVVKGNTIREVENTGCASCVVF